MSKANPARSRPLRAGFPARTPLIRPLLAVTPGWFT
jgi:hypothetical protein